MKIKTLGFLAASGMFLSSLTVWSLTTPEPGRPPLAGPSSRGPEPPSDPGHATTARARFASGNTLLMEGRLGFRTQEAGKPNENFVLIDISASKQAQGTRAPLNLAIVIDRSGSMRGKRLDNALSAARGMIERLRDGDVVSLVSYNTVAEVRAVSKTIDERSRLELERALHGIDARGDTCISCGLETASELLSRREGMVDQMLLLSDGEATTGVKDEAEFRRVAARIHTTGTVISTIGVDVDYNERVMSAIAEEANGRHHFVENAAKLPAIFDEELESLTNTVADEAELTVSLAPGVRVLEVFDRSYRQQGDRLIVPMGSFSSGDERTFLVKLELAEGRPGEQAVADVRLGYRDLTRDDAGNCEGSLSQLLVSGSTELSPLDPLVAGRVERSETARALLDANRLFKAGKADQAQGRLARARARTESKRRQFAQSPFASASKKSADLARDFDEQEEVLAQAEASIAAGPSGKPASPESRAGKAQVRANQSVAREATF